MMNSMDLEKSLQFNVTKALEMFIIPMQNIQVKICMDIRRLSKMFMIKMAT